jgi:hypothetical protein
MENSVQSEEIAEAQRDANRDPLSGEAGSHPVGAGFGAAAGGAAVGIATGAAIGTVAGPVGTAVGGAVGAAIGGVAGAVLGKGIAEEVNPTVEHGFWRSNFATRPYVADDARYDEYGPAYQYGWETQRRFGSRAFDEVEAVLERDWKKARGASSLEWSRAKHAVKDAWDRVAHRKAKSNP